MKKNFVEELKWRGMLHDIMPGTEELLMKESVSGYIGFDPTSDSLHVGSLVQIMFLRHFQNAGHKPIALLGGATGMIGDPSGKSEERKLLTPEQLKFNEDGIKKQFQKYLDFNGAHPAEVVNNAEWFAGISTITFLREAGKYLTVNYLLSKGFVKDRLASESEFSFTEFNYILMQAYDFMWLYQNKNCKMQMGGSDQWGNITAGSELIRKKFRGEAFAITCPLMTKSDGGKFGKTESGNVWLDPEKTSPYKFYQFWINATDADSSKYIRIFTVMEKEEIEVLEKQHLEAPHLRMLQKKLAEQVTIFVHSKKELDDAIAASEILFGNSTKEAFEKLDEQTFMDIFEGVPTSNIEKDLLKDGINLVEFLSEKTNVFPSKGEVKRNLLANAVSINKEKVSDASSLVNASHLIRNKYILIQKGKKNYHLVVAV